jgi:hypothetical protein
MIGETILHCPPEADQPTADKILEKIGEPACRRQGRPVHRSSFKFGDNL